MSILKKRCPRCKREVRVRAVFSRGDYGKSLVSIKNQYQCSSCGTCFKVHLKKQTQDDPTHDVHDINPQSPIGIDPQILTIRNKDTNVWRLVHSYNKVPLKMVKMEKTLRQIMSELNRMSDTQRFLFVQCISDQVHNIDNHIRKRYGVPATVEESEMSENEGKVN